MDYAPISAAQNAIMKVYASNGTLIKTSSFRNGLKTTATGKAQFATSLSDNTIKNVISSIMFTDSSECQFLKSNKCQAESRSDYSTIIINDNTPLSQSYRDYGLLIAVYSDIKSIIQRTD
ncbi:MAG: hypothetical protein M3P08_06150 [Thermoproteota archaeon]|nr:hypothetical protein [Thermoproteota archaeon]